MRWSQNASDYRFLHPSTTTATIRAFSQPISHGVLLKACSTPYPLRLWIQATKRANAVGAAPTFTPCNAPIRPSCHTDRANGITTYLLPAKRWYNKARSTDCGPQSPSTTKLNDRTSDAIILDEVEHILI